jgi:hypothetical protein
VPEAIEIDGLTKYEKLQALPEDVLLLRRGSKYDRFIMDAKTGPVKLAFDSDKRALGVYLGLQPRSRSRNSDSSSGNVDMKSTSFRANYSIHEHTSERPAPITKPIKSQAAR